MGFNYPQIICIYMYLYTCLSYFIVLNNKKQDQSIKTSMDWQSIFRRMTGKSISWDGGEQILKAKFSLHLKIWACISFRPQYFWAACCHLKTLSFLVGTLWFLENIWFNKQVLPSPSKTEIVRDVLFLSTITCWAHHVAGRPVWIK